MTVAEETVPWRGVNHLALVTGDMDATVRFWHGVIDARLVTTLATPAFKHYFFEVAPGEAPVKAEYESVFALGPLCGIRDPEMVLRASRSCDELGLDTISAGGTIAFAMECAERGLFDGTVFEAEVGESRQ